MFFVNTFEKITGPMIRNSYFMTRILSAGLIKTKYWKNGCLKL